MEDVTVLMTSLRVIQFLLAIIVISLGAATVSVNDGHGSFYHGSDPYSVFCGVWTLLIAPFLLLSTRVYEIVADPLSFVIFEGLCNVFWLSCWVALVCAWSGTSCAGLTSCSIAKANIAFSLLTWISFAISGAVVIISAIPFFRYDGLSMNLKGLTGGYVPHPFNVQAKKQSARPQDNDIFSVARDLESQNMPIQPLRVYRP